MPVSVYAYPPQFSGLKFVDLIYQDKKGLSHQFYFQNLYRAPGSKDLDTKAARPRGLTRLCSGHLTSLGRQDLGAEAVFCICEQSPQNDLLLLLLLQP